MAEHTPGPWQQYGDCVFAPGENGGNICVVSAVRASALVEYTKLSLSSTGREEAYANARLIASAPELYDIAKLVETIKGISAEQRILSDEEAQARGFVLYGDRRAAEIELWDKVERAIAKAKGKKEDA